MSDHNEHVLFPGAVHDDHTIGGFVAEYRWLSNFWPTKLEYDGITYYSSEAAYQAAKFTRVDRYRFACCSAGSAKRLAHELGWDPIEWNERKVQVMTDVLYAKFTQNLELKDKLVLTGKKYLEETNYWGDTFWGVCKDEGTNQLGILLMELREKLRNE
jgi:ribA/ribD-fused uncharacterized protein